MGIRCPEFLHEPVCLLLFFNPQHSRAAVAESADRGGLFIDIEDTVQKGHGGRQGIPAFKSGCVQIVDVIDSAVFAIYPAQGFRRGVRRGLTGGCRNMDGRGKEFVDIDPVEFSEFDEEGGLGSASPGAVVIHGGRGDPELLGKPLLRDPQLSDQDPEIGFDDCADLLVGFSGHGHERIRRRRHRRSPLS